MKAARHAIPLAALLLATTAIGGANATTVTIATVNNPDMIVMQELSKIFEAQNPDITLEWTVLEENVLRQRVTTDITTNGGQFDIVTVGAFEVPQWAERGWIEPMTNLPADYDEADILPAIRGVLSFNDTLYGLPFYGESSMMMYRKDLFDKAGLTMPDQPTWEQVQGFAKAITDPANGVFGICLRGKPGWGENMAFLTTLANAFGGRWFDLDWNPQLESEPWKNAVSFYVDLMQNYGPPGAASNGFNENLTLFASGKCGMWVDATVAAGFVSDPSQSDVSGDVAFASAPRAVTDKGANWLWSWSLAIPSSSDAKDAALEFVTWATSKPYIELVAANKSWGVVPPGTRTSTYENPNYQAAAPFASRVLASINSADPNDPVSQPVPYVGVQYVAIPQFQGIGNTAGQFISAALVGNSTVDEALAQAESVTERTVRRAGLLK